MLTRPICSRRRLTGTAVAVLALLVVRPSSASDRSLRCEADGTEREIYAAVLRSEQSDSAPIVVKTETEGLHFRIDLGSLLFGEIVASLAPRLISAPKGSVIIFSSPPPGALTLPRQEIQALNDDFERKNRTPCQIGAPPTNWKLVRYISPAILDRLFNSDDPIPGWRRFHELYGDNAELFWFSRVAFGRERKLAIVHVSAGIGHMAAGGRLYLLAFVNHKWSILRAYPTWTT